MRQFICTLRQHLAEVLDDEERQPLRLRVEGAGDCLGHGGGLRDGPH